MEDVIKFFTSLKIYVPDVRTPVDEMPWINAHVCVCGRTIKAGTVCECRVQAARERKARHDLTRPNSSRRGYNATWEAERAKFLERYPVCAMCPSPATVVDHVKAHKGDAALFWDQSNWQPLCAHHHNSTKQRQERGTNQGYEK